MICKENQKKISVWGKIRESITASLSNATAGGTVTLNVSFENTEQSLHTLPL
jgi:hypothetical protein